MIGVFDSGIGGLTVLHEVMKQLPNEDYCYYADTINVPYSTKSEEDIRCYVNNAVNFLIQKKVKAIVFACNTATNVCVEDLRIKHTNLPIIAIQPAVKVAVDNDSQRKKILVCATPITLRSLRFENLLSSLNAQNLVERMAMPELVKFAENEDFDSNEVIEYLTESLNQIDIHQFGSIVLGCTHFTYFEPIFNKIAPNLKIYDGNEGTARHLRNILTTLNLMDSTPKNSVIEFVESGKISQNIERFKRYLTFIEHLNL